MKKAINYYVIGGQYEHIAYGGTATLTGAKRLATASVEYWDNWQGWHKPSIYRADDCVEIESRGRITTRDGENIIVPRRGASPAYIWRGGKWETAEESAQ